MATIIIWKGAKWQVEFEEGGVIRGRRLSDGRRFGLRHQGFEWSWSQDITASTAATLARLPELRAHLRHNVQVPLS